MLNIYLTSFHMILLMVTQKADALIFALAALFCLSDCGFGLEWGEVLSCFSWEELWSGGGMGGPEGELLIHKSSAGDGGAAAGRGREDAERWWWIEWMGEGCRWL